MQQTTSTDKIFGRGGGGGGGGGGVLVEKKFKEKPTLLIFPARSL